MYDKETVPRNVFEETVRILFEGHMISAPQDYDYYLSNRYGVDYMTPPPKSEQGVKCFVRREHWKELK